MDQEQLAFLSDPATLWSIGLGLAGIILLWALLRGGGSKRRIRKLMKSVSADMLTDVILPDGVGGLVEIEYLLLAPKGVVVVDVKDYKGVLFGADNTDVWSQVLGVKSFKFKNPLPQNKVRIQAVKVFFPKHAVLGRVVFTNEGRFPKGMPSDVSMLDQAKSDLVALAGTGEVPADLRAAWDNFKQTLANSAFNPR